MGAVELARRLAPAVFALALVASTASAQEITLVSSAAEPGAGEVFTVIADLSSPSEIGAYDLGVTYDPAVLAFISATQLATLEVSSGVFERQAFTFVAVSGGAGDLILTPINETLLLDTPPNRPAPPPGSETGLFQLTFQAIVLPQATPIAVGETLPTHGVLGTDGALIDLVEGVAVVEVPEPSLWLQWLAALVTLGFARGRPRWLQRH